MVRNITIIFSNLDMKIYRSIIDTSSLHYPIIFSGASTISPAHHAIKRWPWKQSFMKWILNLSAKSVTIGILVSFVSVWKSIMIMKLQESRVVLFLPNKTLNVILEKKKVENERLTPSVIVMLIINRIRLKTVRMFILYIMY